MEIICSQGRKFFLFRLDPFSEPEGFGVQKIKQKVTKFIFLVKLEKKLPRSDLIHYLLGLPRYPEGPQSTDSEKNNLLA